MAEEFLIRIIPDGLGGSGEGAGALPSGGSGSGAGGLGGIGKSVGGAFSGVLKALGVGSVIGIIIGIVSSFKQLISLVQNIFKLVGTLLKPIADVITVLLMPILFILKPIAILVNQVMAPFIRLAMDVMKQGAQKVAGGNLAGGLADFGAAGAIVLQGLGAVIVALSGQLVKMIVGLVADLGALLLSFIPGVGDKIAQGVVAFKEGLSVVVDTASATAVAGIAAGSALIAETVGVSSDKFKKDVSKMITNVFTDAKGLNTIFSTMLGLESGFGKEGVDAINQVVGEDGFTGTFKNSFDTFKNTGVNKINEVVGAFNEAIQKLQKPGFGGGSSRGLFGIAADAVGEIATLGFAKTETFR